MKLHKVIRWEFLSHVRSKQFLIMTLLLPAIIAVAIFAITLSKGIGVSASQANANPPPPFIIGLLLGLILFIGAFMSGVMAMYAIIKEKQSRVVELMLSSVSAWDLMAGKIIGLGMAGLIQVFTWAATAYFVANRFASFPLSSLTLVHWITFPLYFILGYLLIASMFALVGAAIKDIHSGGAVGLIGFIPYLPMVLTPAIVENPDMTWLRIAGFFPPFTPGIMMLRIGATPMVSEGARFVPLWEIALSLCTLALGVFLMMRFTTKVFHVGMLMYGKSASFRELWKWGRQRTT
ncbi:MAG: ABC transporter permease [Candidatus Atribacteria bacterium]|nr:MAG: ABC transporter permease [Candidatus Atribacteria bacterium]